MALKGFVDEARKTNQLMANMAQQKAGSQSTIIDVSNGQGIPQEKLDELRSQQTTVFQNPQREQFRAIPNNKPKTDFERQYMQRNRESTIQRPNNSSQTIDDRHCNIIANVIKESGNHSTGYTTWENCKHKKDANGNTYCKEFMSLCGKEKCKRATK
ncbi:MAG: hypothetical protein WC915_02985 [archaeon]|jgi:hypothetical protein